MKYLIGANELIVAELEFSSGGNSSTQQKAERWGLKTKLNTKEEILKEIRSNTNVLKNRLQGHSEKSPDLAWWQCYYEIEKRKEAEDDWMIIFVQPPTD